MFIGFNFSAILTWSLLAAVFIASILFPFLYKSLLIVDHELAGESGINLVSFVCKMDRSALQNGAFSLA